MNPKCQFQLVSLFGFGFNRDFPGLKPLKPYETKMKVSMVSTVSKINVKRFRGLGHELAPLTAVSPPCPHNSLFNAMPVQWVAHATNTGVVKAPVIAQKCPQEGRVGRREAAARGCPRRKQCDLGFVQVSCPLEHTSNPAASVCLLPMPACNLPARLLLSIAG